jgi:hypothetical protein
MLTTALGLKGDAINRILQISDPRLPDWLSVVNVRNLHVGTASVDLHFERTEKNTLATVVGQRGDLMVKFDS